MGSHKTIVDKKGNLKWSPWSLKRKPLDTPIGFSMQMDGELAIEAFTGATPLTVTSQTLHNGRYPFIVTKLTSPNLSLEKLAFTVDPDFQPDTIPDRNSGSHGLDVVRLTFRNDSASPQDATLRLSGRERNLPGHVMGSALITGAGEDIALVTETAGATLTPEANGLALAMHLTVPAHASETLSLRLAAMNHSYTTNVFKEEILVDIDAPRACDTPHSKRANGEGTGDMPEAWGKANAVLILRDMLLNERPGADGITKLHLLPGLLAEWVPVGKSLSLANSRQQRRGHSAPIETCVVAR